MRQNSDRRGKVRTRRKMTRTAQENETSNKGEETRSEKDKTQNGRRTGKKKRGGEEEDKDKGQHKGMNNLIRQRARGI